MTMIEVRPSQVVSSSSLTRALAEYYREEGHVVHVGEQYRGRTPDVHVEAGPRRIWPFKLLAALPEDPTPLIRQWKRFDLADFEWWLCVSEEEIDQVEELLEGTRLSNMNLCSWTCDKDGEFGFYDVP